MQKIYYSGVPDSKIHLMFMVENFITKYSEICLYQILNKLSKPGTEKNDFTLNEPTKLTHRNFFD